MSSVYRSKSPGLGFCWDSIIYWQFADVFALVSGHSGHVWFLWPGAVLMALVAYSDTTQLLRSVSQEKREL